MTSQVIVSDSKGSVIATTKYVFIHCIDRRYLLSTSKQKKKQTFLHVIGRNF